MLLVLALAGCTGDPPAPVDAAGTASDAAGSDVPPASSGAAAKPPPTGTPPPPANTRGVLPLRPGVYVIAGSDCAAPANAGLRFYDGRGISGTATHACEALVRAHEGDRYEVDQSCIDTPAGDGPRTIEPQAITVHDARSFTLETERGAARFNQCPDDAVPDYLRERAGIGGAAP
jgi:hypothetical protein